MGQRMVEARPAGVPIDPARTALIVVDMQNDFASDGGMFQRAGIDVSGIRRIVPTIATILDVARSAGVLVCYLRMGFEPDLSDAGYPKSPTWLKHQPLAVGLEVVAPDGSPSRILVRGTWNTAIIEELTPEPGDLIVDKHRYSGFHDTGLAEMLRARGIDTLLFTGATTSVCVESTVRDAMMNDFHCVVIADCVAEPIGASYERTNHEATLLTLEILFASIAESSSLVEALTASPVGDPVSS
jgi:ureidoacrylate peracid hydrolase